MAKANSYQGAKLTDETLAYIKEMQENDNELIRALQNSITCATDQLIELADFKGAIDRPIQNALANLVGLKKDLAKFSTEGGESC